jgi:hypothetical protein
MQSGKFPCLEKYATLFPIVGKSDFGWRDDVPPKKKRAI